MTAGIELRRTVVRLGGRTLLDGAELAAPAGSVCLLLGRNGAGKTTLLRVLAGVLRPDAGTVTLDGEDLQGLSGRERARRVALVPQEAECPFDFTGRELVAMGRYPHLTRFQGMTGEDDAAVDDALARVDARGFADRPVTTLSGGELRRIALARALATAAPVLLLDEPTANLDLEHVLALGELLRTLAAEGRTLLVATHDVNLLGPVADQVVVLHEGGVARSGTPVDVLGDEGLLRRVFGVRAGSGRTPFPIAFERDRS